MQLPCNMLCVWNSIKAALCCAWGQERAVSTVCEWLHTAVRMTIHVHLLMCVGTSSGEQDGAKRCAVLGESPQATLPQLIRPFRWVPWSWNYPGTRQMDSTYLGTDIDRWQHKWHCQAHSSPDLPSSVTHTRQKGKKGGPLDSNPF